MTRRRGPDAAGDPIEFELLDVGSGGPRDRWADPGVTETVSVSDHQFGRRSSGPAVWFGVVGCLVGVVGILFALGSESKDDRTAPGTSVSAPTTTVAPTTTTEPEATFFEFQLPESFEIDPVPPDKLGMLPYQTLYLLSGGTGYVLDAATGQATSETGGLGDVVRTSFGTVLMTYERFAGIDLGSIQQVGDELWGTNGSRALVHLAPLSDGSVALLPVGPGEALIGAMADGRPVVRAADGRGYAIDAAGSRARIAEGDVDSVVNGNFVEHLCDEAGSCRDLLHGAAVTPVDPSGGLIDYSFAPDGASVLAASDHGRVELIDVATGVSFISTDMDSSGIGPGQIVWAPDGHSVAFIGSLNTTNLLVVMDRQRREVLMRELSADAGMSIYAVR